MYHPPSKRKQILRRIAVYSLMTTAVAGLVTILVMLILGYQFNRNDGLVQGGLVQFGSKPGGASVTIDGANFGARTPSKTTLPAGQHFITMQRDGYKAWQKAVDVEGGAVLWLNYARLIPADLKPTHEANFAMVSSTTVSPDSRWMAVKEGAQTPSFRIADLSGEEVNLTDITLPTGSYTPPNEGEEQQFELVQWHANSRHLLMKHTYGDNQREWIVVDTRDVGATQNLSTLLDIDASKMIFSSNDSNILYAQIGSAVRRIDRGKATISRPLVDNVAEFSLYDNSFVIFTSQPHPETKKRTIGYYSESDDKTYKVGSYADDGKAPARLAIGEYFGDTYVAVSRGDTIEVLTGDLSRPSELRRVVTMPLPGGAQHMSIVNSGRFVTAQNDATYAVYDLELKKATTTTLRGTGAVKNELRWLDGYTLWSDRDGKLRLYEFDGTNQHTIMSVAPGFSVTLSPNQRYLYGIVKSSSGTYHLERVQMVL
jgi:hypothetical protein